jgi:hypothetical protein
MMRTVPSSQSGVSPIPVSIYRNCLFTKAPPSRRGFFVWRGKGLARTGVSSCVFSTADTRHSDNYAQPGLAGSFQGHRAHHHHNDAKADPS